MVKFILEHGHSFTAKSITDVYSFLFKQIIYNILLNILQLT